jgi:hypothetical protein
MKNSKVSQSVIVGHYVDLGALLIRIGHFPLGANMKNASLVTEVEELNRKVREILEQVREKDRQISKLQGNYSKVSFPR